MLSFVQEPITIFLLLSIRSSFGCVRKEPGFGLLLPCRPLNGVSTSHRSPSATLRLRFPRIKLLSLHPYLAPLTLPYPHTMADEGVASHYQVLEELGRK